MTEVTTRPWGLNQAKKPRVPKNRKYSCHQFSFYPSTEDVWVDASNLSELRIKLDEAEANNNELTKVQEYCEMVIKQTEVTHPSFILQQIHVHHMRYEDDHHYAIFLEGYRGLTDQEVKTKEKEKKKKEADRAKVEEREKKELLRLAKKHPEVLNEV